jgi:RNA polymerase sigma-70 factor (ECF subfamily)
MSHAGSYADDASVVRRVLAGEVDAFEEIVERWQGPLINLAWRFCRNRGKAEEMAQEAFVKIYRGLPRWRQDARFSTWAYTVAMNHYRSVMRRTMPPSVDLDAVAPIIEAGNLNTEVDGQLRDEAVRRAVSALPAKYRDVVVLYYLQEMDLQETARAAGLREGTVKARLFRARKMLGQRLQALMSTPVTAPAEV